MINAINPLKAQWVHTWIVEPFLEGASRVNRAWLGVNSHTIKQTPLSLKERVVSLLTGLVLLIPLVSIIVWLAWQTFGRPERLSDPYCPPGAVPVQIPTSAHVIPVPPPAKGSRIQRFAFTETKKHGQSYDINWEVHNGTYVKQDSPKSESISLYDSNGRITEFHHEPDKKSHKKPSFHIWLRDSNRLEVHLGNSVNWFHLKDRLWIQQPFLGLRNFVLSNQTEVRFSGISSEGKLFTPSPPFEVCFIARKTGTENGLTKVDVNITWPFPLAAGVLWFDAAGKVMKFNNILEGKHEVRKPDGP